MPSPPQTASPRIFTLDEIERVTETEDFRKSLIEGIVNGFREFHNGNFFAAPIQTLGAPPMAPFVQCNDYAAQTCIKSGYFANNPYYVVKVASGGHPMPNSGLMQVYSQASGRLEALLLDEGVLTELRTAAFGSMSVRKFGPKEINNSIGILGTGVQARYQLEMLKQVTACRSVLVWGRSLEKANQFAVEMADKGWKVETANAPDDLLVYCDVIITTTSARKAILGLEEPEKQRKTQLIVCIGSDAPGKQEISTKLLGEANLLIADSADQSLERGEFQRVSASRAVHSIAGLLLGDDWKQLDDDHSGRLIVVDSSGVALQDCVIAQMVCNALLPLNDKLD